MDLRRLDDLVVPRAAAWVRTVHDRARRLPRSAPVVGVLTAVTVLVAGAGVALGLVPSSGQGGPPSPPEAAVLGPAVGVDAEDHLAAARSRLDRSARERPEARHVALVSLHDELTVEQTARLVAESPLVVRRAYVRAPVVGLPELFAVDVAQDPERTLSSFWAATAGRKAEQQRELLVLATSAGGTASAEPVARVPHDAAARTAGQEAAAYAAGCACVLALVLEGPAGALAELASLPGVRGVEVAPRGSRLATTQVTPLPPEVSGPVPAPAGG